MSAQKFDEINTPAGKSFSGNYSLAAASFPGLPRSCNFRISARRDQLKATLYMKSKHGSGSCDDFDGDHPVGSASVTRRTWWNSIEYTDPPFPPSLLYSLLPIVARRASDADFCCHLLVATAENPAVPSPSLRPMLLELHRPEGYEGIRRTQGTDGQASISSLILTPMSNDQSSAKLH